MPGLTFRDVIRILERHGFSHKRTRGSHAQYEGVIDDRRRLVTVQTDKLGERVKRGTLGSIIRQSGLPKSAFE